MRSVLVYTPEAHLSHPTRDLPIVHALRALGHRTTYAIPVEGYTVRELPQMNFPVGILERDAFKQVQTRPVRSHADLETLIKDHDVLLIGLTKDTMPARLARAHGRFLIQHQDKGGVDLHNFEPDFLAVPGNWYRQTGSKWHRMPLDRTIVTGSVQFDRARDPEVLSVTRESFCERYRLDPSKPIITWLPEGPGTHTAWYRSLYQQICRTVAQSGQFNLLIKGHPWDYVGHGVRDTAARPSWESLAPGVTVCASEDAYACFQHSDLGITVTSTVYLDFSAFRKPVLFVDFQEGAITSSESDIEGIRPRRYDGFGLRRLRLYPETLALARTLKNSRTLFSDPIYSGGDGLPFVGAECSHDELESVLAAKEYMTITPSDYDSVLSEFCYRIDGQSAHRIAALVGRLPAIPTPPPSQKLWRKILNRPILRRARKLLHV